MSARNFHRKDVWPAGQASASTARRRSASSTMGDPSIVRGRLGDRVMDLLFDRDTIYTPVLSIDHLIRMFENTLGPVVKLVESLTNDPARLSEVREGSREIVRPYFRTCRRGRPKGCPLIKTHNVETGRSGEAGEASTHRPDE